MSDARSGDDWARLSSLVDALLDAPAEKRAALITQLSGNDPAQRAELEQIIADFDRDTPLADRPAAERFAALLDDHTGRFPDVLAERYSLTREVGRGGMATVYLARDLKHGRDVAVKVVHPVLATTLGSERFLREIEIVAQLHHPHIVPLFDSGEAQGALYYVMPFETGHSVRQRIEREGALPIDDAVVILRDVCDALAYAHARGIVHRDIKPDNVMLSGRHAMVTDFGVAKALTGTVDSRPNDGTMPSGSSLVTTAGAIFGTPAYMSPEQIAGGLVDHRADIYSVGALAYELIAGRPPFDSRSREDVLSAHLTETPPPLTSVRADVPAPLADLVTKCLAKQPADRWQKADELVAGLERLTIEPGVTGPPIRRRSWRVVVAATTAIVALAALVARQRASAPDDSWRPRWDNVHVERLTDFPGSEVDATISRDGQMVAFLADRDSVFDTFVTRVGTGQFSNLTLGRHPQLFNEDVRNVGFSHDASEVSMRIADMTSPASVWLTPTSGGALRPFLSTAVMAVWSPDGSRVAYHETTPGDPIFIADSAGRDPRRVFVAEPGVHNHHLSWSPDGRYLYFSHGLPPNDMDIWRVPVAGGEKERITTQTSRVAYPVLLDDRTLLYTATAEDGTGPWLYSMDLDTRQAVRVITAIERYISIAAAADVPGQPRRLVATVSNPTVGLWTARIADAIVEEDSVRRVDVPTARSAAPRFAPDGSLFYLASRGGADAVWRLSADTTVEVWKTTEGEVAGAGAVAPDGSQVCFPVRRRQRSTLVCMSPAGENVRTLGDSLDVRGSASWSPDGKWIAVAARDGPGVHIYKIPVSGGPPVRLVDSVSSSPVWAPNGEFIVYSGTPRARSVPVKAVTPDGEPYPMPDVLVDRIGDSYRFASTNQLVVKLGGFRRQDLWLVDLATHQRRRLTSLKPGESLSRFDVSPGGDRVVFERVRENSDIALIVLPPRK